MFRKKICLINIILIGILVYPLYILAQGVKEQAATYSKKEMEDKKVLRIMIAPIISPQESFFFYRKLFDYIGDKLGYEIKFSMPYSYGETNTRLECEEGDLAFVCSRPYIEGHDDFGLELLVAPQVRGEVVYYSYLIVHKDSSIKEFKELRNKIFAFSDPLSLSGKLISCYLLAQIEETAGTYFKDLFYTYSHDALIKAVAHGLADGATVDSLIWEYINRIHPEITAQTKVVWKSPPLGMPPVVVRPGIDPGLKEDLKQVFLNMHKDEKGREILQGMMIDKFVVVEDNLYNEIRQMISFVNRKNRAAKPIEQKNYNK
jgi:phosphonate transport system substrate-binding protein